MAGSCVLQIRTIRSTLDDVAKATDKQLVALFDQRLLSDRTARELELRSLTAGISGERLTAATSSTVRAAFAELAPMQLKEQLLKSLLLLVRDKVCVPQVIEPVGSKVNRGALGVCGLRLGVSVTSETGGVCASQTLKTKSGWAIALRAFRLLAQ
jgi:hypothetical protein